MSEGTRHVMNADRFIMNRLRGRIWHSTSLERFALIKKQGFIQPEPDIPNSQRTSTGKGPDWYFFVRHIGGFSVFDFPGDFDLEEYRGRCPVSSIDALIPFRQDWGHSVWLEIDQTKQSASLIRGSAVWKQCEAEGRGKRCMPHIEGAHIGDMPVSSILAAYIIAEGDADWHSIH